MRNLLTSYADWIHLRFPGGSVEKLPRVDEHYQTNVPGVYVVGDLAGVPLLKFSLDSGTKAVRHIIEHDEAGPSPREDEVLDLAIVGAGASGMAAAREAKAQGLTFTVLEANRTFATIKDFQREKPIYTYPREMTPEGSLHVSAPVKEELVAELEQQTDDIPVRYAEVDRLEQGAAHHQVVLVSGERIPARHVVVAIGRSGQYRQLDVPGEEKEHVHHELHDPTRHRGRDVVVVGGGDAAAEAAIALVEEGARVILSYRRDAFFRPKEENIHRLHELARQASNGSGSLQIKFESEVKEIDEQEVILSTAQGHERVPADVVFALIGREAPLDFFRRSGFSLRNDWGVLPDSLREAASGLDWVTRLNWSRIAAFAAFLLFMAGVYSWKDGGLLGRWSEASSVFPYSLAALAEQLDAASLAGVTLRSMQAPTFYYTLVYSLIVVLFGYRRIRRRKTPYVKWQTFTLAAVQVLPLFILPEIVLPYLGANGLLPEGLLDGLFPVSEHEIHGREYWRAYGFILAWPLLVYNVFTAEPLFWWLAICFVQTFVLIPGMIYFWGKGAYCGWICSCGAMAETLGDRHRDKMPHGEGWNKFNLAGQMIMVLAFALLFLRVVSWIWPGGWADGLYGMLMYGEFLGLQLNYTWTVDVVLAGMLGYGVFFWLSGRFWCRFLCPLAALMHIYTRFSRFRILSEKEKCISCNVCTSVCHQGIDVRHYAQRGIPMDDPQCVRCSACVQSCPTGVLSFGQVDPATEQVISVDQLKASLHHLPDADNEAADQFPEKQPQR